MLLPFLPVFLLWLTVLLGPTYLPRYVLFFWYALPLILGVSIETEKCTAFAFKNVVYSSQNRHSATKELLCNSFLNVSLYSRMKIWYTKR